MAIIKGSHRYRNTKTNEIKYFTKEPTDTNLWEKVGTPGSKNWKWINNGVNEEYVSPNDPVPEGYCLGRIKR